MSQETTEQNVEIVRAIYAIGFNLEGDVDQKIDSAFRDYLEDEFEIRQRSAWPEGGEVFRGREGVRRLVLALGEVWSEWDFEPEQFLEAGDRVVVFVHLRAQGFASGAPVDVRTAHVWTLRDGRAVCWEPFLDRGAALEAAGLGE